MTQNAVICQSCGHLGEPVVKMKGSIYERQCPFCGHPSESQPVLSLGDTQAHPEPLRDL